MTKINKNPTREKIFNFIKEFFEDKGYSPTVRDILRGCKISSTAVVQHHLNMLEKEGLIHRDPEVFRSIQLTERAKLKPIPILGTIAAGIPLPVISSDTWHNEVVDTIYLAEDMFKENDVYALKVKGDSMIDALIGDGDYVIMAPPKTISNGDMVAAWLKDKEEVTLKRYYYEFGKVRLQPENTTMKPIICSPENVEIHGKVVGVIRKIQ